MKFLPSTNQAITTYQPQPPLVYNAEIVELDPEPIAEIDLFKCPTAKDIVQAEKELESNRKLSYWGWLKEVLG